MNRRKLLSDEELVSIEGYNLDEYKAQQKLHKRISEESQKHENTNSSDWPAIEFNWDTSKKGQRFSCDNLSLNGFLQNYPDGFLLGKVNLKLFDKKLCHYSRRDEGELWEVGYVDKLACLIVYLSEGHKISPPLVKPLDTGEVIFKGGHHRYAIAKELEVESIPIYIEPQYREKIDNILDISWLD